MKRFLAIFVLAIFCFTAFAQNEPGNNIGKSLRIMKQEFPELRYIKTDTKGDKYEDGYPQDGIATFFYFKEQKVIEECMIVQSNDGFARMWYDQMVEAFLKYSYGFGTSGYNSKHWVYSTFTLHLIYVSEGGINTAMVVYEKGGYNTGVTGAEFFKKYRN